MEQEILNGFKILTRFKETPLMSTYSFGFIAGDYSYIQIEDTDSSIPMTIYFRNTMRKYVNIVIDDLTALINKGIKFFSRSFNQAYPFSKYDQVFVPEFNAGAMENIGLVIINENYIHKDTMGELDYGSLGNVILHELSHMWFGNLVTMKWWDDTWLNEAFATAMSLICIEEEGTLDKYLAERYMNFLSVSSAYIKDQMPSNHKITSIINDTSQAELIFDPLTYQKGAAIIRTLYKSLGKDSFMDSISKYIKMFKYSNADRNDFISCFTGKSTNHINVEKWFHDWIETKGVNLLVPIISKEPTSKKIVEFDIQQKILDNGEPIFRNMNIDLLYVFNHTINDLDTFFHISRYPFNINQQQIVDELGSSRPIISKNDILYTNLLINSSNLTLLDPKYFSDVNDPKIILINPYATTYALTYLDNDSADNILNSEILPTDPICKLQTFQSLSNMAKGSNIPSMKLINRMMNFILNERDEILVRPVFAYFMTVLEECILFKEHLNYFKNIFAKLYGKVLSEKDPIFLQIYARYLNFFAAGKDEKLKLYNFTQNFPNIFGKLDSSIKYPIICNIFALESIPIKEKYLLMNTYFLKDETGLADSSKKLCEASLPDIEHKDKLWEWYNNENLNTSIRMYAASMMGFLRSENETFHQKYAKLFVENIANIFENRNPIFAKIYFAHLKPLIIKNEPLKIFEDLLTKIPEQQFTLRSLLQDYIFSSKRSIKCIEFNQGLKDTYE